MMGGRKTREDGRGIWWSGFRETEPLSKVQGSRVSGAGANTSKHVGGWRTLSSLRGGGG